MSRSERRSDPGKSREWLQRRHQELDDKVNQFEERLSLTDAEQIQLQKLKKEKLATKDAIQRLEV